MLYLCSGIALYEIQVASQEESGCVYGGRIVNWACFSGLACMIVLHSGLEILVYQDAGSNHIYLTFLDYTADIAII